jgi:hypothetical protein
MLDEIAENATDQEADTPKIKDDEMSEWLRYFGVEESDSG